MPLSQNCGPIRVLVERIYIPARGSQFDGILQVKTCHQNFKLIILFTSELLRDISMKCCTHYHPKSISTEVAASGSLLAYGIKSLCLVIYETEQLLTVTTHDTASTMYLG
jgi:hypothetical protein